MHVRFPVFLAGLTTILPLSGCAWSTADTAQAPSATTTTVTVTQIAGAATPRATDIVNAAHQWTGGPDGTGIFSVGSQPRDGLAASIPPGRYTVKVAPGAEHGHWIVCDSALCGPGFQDHAAIIGNPVGAEASAIYIGPQARTLWVDHVEITPIGD